MIHLLGYIGSAINLLGMTMRNVKILRYFSMLANGIYVAYGVQLGSIPIIISSFAAVLVHIYYISKKNDKTTK